MNNKRNIFELIIVALLSLNMFFGIIMFAGYLSKPHDIMASGVFIAGLAGLCTFSLASMVMAIITYIMINKEYDAQYEEYKIEFIRSNQQREKSALLMTAISAILLYPLFPMINAWLKSGLSTKEREHAKQLIRVKRVDKFLKQDVVIAKLKENKVEADEIKRAVKLRNKKIDTKFNCNLYILKLLNKIEAEYEVIYNPKEVYYLGMNY